MAERIEISITFRQQCYDSVTFRQLSITFKQQCYDSDVDVFKIQIAASF